MVRSRSRRTGYRRRDDQYGLDDEGDTQDDVVRRMMWRWRAGTWGRHGRRWQARPPVLAVVLVGVAGAGWARLAHPTAPGQALPLVAAALPLLVTVVGLALDGGVVFAARRELQNVADAAARAGATEVDPAAFSGHRWRGGAGRATGVGHGERVRRGLQRPAPARPAGVARRRDPGRTRPGGRGGEPRRPDGLPADRQDLSRADSRRSSRHGAGRRGLTGGKIVVSHAMVGKRSAVWVGVLTLSVVLAAGCEWPGRRPSAAPPVPTAQPTPTAAPPAATAVPTAPPATPTAVPIPLELRHEIEDAYVRYWHVRADAALTLDPSLLPEVAAGDRLEREREEIAQLRAEGRARKVVVDLQFRVVRATETTATVHDDFKNWSYAVDLRTQGASRRTATHRRDPRGVVRDAEDRGRVEGR